MRLEFTTKREEVLQTLENLQTETQKVLDLIENPEVIAALRQDKLQNLNFLKEKYGVCVITLELFVDLIEFIFDDRTLSFSFYSLIAYR